MWGPRASGRRTCQIDRAPGHRRVRCGLWRPCGAEIRLVVTATGIPRPTNAVQPNSRGQSRFPGAGGRGRRGPEPGAHLADRSIVAHRAVRAHAADIPGGFVGRKAGQKTASAFRAQIVYLKSFFWLTRTIAIGPASVGWRMSVCGEGLRCHGCSPKGSIASGAVATAAHLFH